MTDHVRCACTHHDAVECQWARSGMPIAFHVGDVVGERAERECEENPCSCACHEPEEDDYDAD